MFMFIDSQPVRRREKIKGMAHSNNDKTMVRLFTQVFEIFIFEISASILSVEVNDPMVLQKYV